MPDRDLTSFIGQPVLVVIDRPLGTRHPRHPALRYPVNYGYLPGTVSGDGAPIDAYVRGVDAPVATFEGVVIALVVRADDVEDKLVVGPPGTRFSQTEIADAVAFQEQYFASSITMASPMETSLRMNVEKPIANDIEIITATPDHWQSARNIRMEALLRAPEAYSGTYAEAAARSEDEWRAWLSRPGLTMLLAQTAQRPVGIVGGLRGDALEDHSVGWVVSMYVSADYRQQGVGRRLLQTLLDDLARDARLTRVRLNVATSQIPAQRLYASLGFVPVGEEDNEIIMERPLR